MMHNYMERAVRASAAYPAMTPAPLQPGDPRIARMRAESDFWARETETPSSWEDGPDGPRCIHVGLLPHAGANLDDEWLCGHCGQMVPERDL